MGKRAAAFRVIPRCGLRRLAVFLLLFSVLLVGCRERRTSDEPMAQMASPLSGAVTPASTALPPTTLTPSVMPAATPPSAGQLAGHRICLDPGHDAVWVPGATGRDAAGRVPVHPAEGVPLLEHELTLAVAERLARLLEQEGAEVCMTRRPRSQGGGLTIEPYDFTGDGRVRPSSAGIDDAPERAQPRIDVANRFGADILVSIHFNGLDDRLVRGTEVYYPDTGPRQAEARRLAASLLSALIGELRLAGHAAVERGVLSDRYERYTPAEFARIMANNAHTVSAQGLDAADCYDCMRLFVLGHNPLTRERAQYVGVLVEIEFLSNPAVVEGLILRLDSLDLFARGLACGVLTYYAAVGTPACPLSQR